MQCETVKIKPSSPEQGDFVIINKADFDETIHTLFEATEPTSDEALAVEPKKRGRPAKE